MPAKLKVLAVDDEPRNLKIITIGLGDKWEVKTAVNGEEALSVAASFNPDILLLDIMMPKMDGYEVTRKLRSQSANPFLKIVLVSGKAMLEERLKGYECGADDYITKPFAPEELVSKVNVYARLVTTERALHELNQSLEAKVAERTLDLADSQAKLINAAKMASLGEMAGGIAHEINTPLTVLRLMADQLIEALAEPTINREFTEHSAKTISETVMRVAHIIQGLRNFAREGKNDPLKPFAVKEVLEDTLALCKAKFTHHGVNLEQISVPEDLYMLCRPTQISQIVLNLLNNAVDAMTGPEKWIRVDVTSDDKWIYLGITDSGSGVPADIRDKLFQPFFTTKQIGKGTGLGLSISKGLAQSQGGDLILDTKSQHTKFIVMAPRALSVPNQSLAG